MEHLEQCWDMNSLTDSTIMVQFKMQHDYTFTVLILYVRDSSTDSYLKHLSCWCLPFSLTVALQERKLFTAIFYHRATV